MAELDVNKGPRLSRRRVLQAAVLGGIATGPVRSWPRAASRPRAPSAAAGASAGASAGDQRRTQRPAVGRQHPVQDRLRQPADRRRGRLRRTGPVHHRSGRRSKLKSGFSAGGKDYAITIVQKDGQSDPRQGCPGRQRPDQHRQDRLDAGDVDAGEQQPRRRRVRGGRRAVHHDRRTLGGVLLRTAEGPREPGPVQVHLPLLVRRGRVRQDLHLVVGRPGQDEQEGRRHVAQRCRWQRHPCRRSGRPSTKAGYTIVDPGPYEDGTNDYSAQIAKFKAENCEIFNTFPLPPDFATFWKQAAAQGYVPKIAQIAKTGLFPSQIEALGDLGPGLASAAYWHADIPVQVAPDRDLVGGLVERIHRRPPASSGTRTSARPWRSSTRPRARWAPRPIPRTRWRWPRRSASSTSPRRSARSTSHRGHSRTCRPAPSSVVSGSRIRPGKFKVDFVIAENATDPNVPIATELTQYRP